MHIQICDHSVFPIVYTFVPLRRIFLPRFLVFYSCKIMSILVNFNSQNNGFICALYPMRVGDEKLDKSVLSGMVSVLASPKHNNQH